MVRLNRIYTKAGDGGDTRLVGGQKVRKDSLRIEAYGTIDELSACIGLARTTLAAPGAPAGAEALATILLRVQNELFNLGSDLATLAADRRPNQPVIEERHATKLEDEIDAWNTTLPELRSFVLPGGGMVAAYLHLARTVCRRAERLIVRLADAEPIGAAVIPYVNRLSDALFVMSRHAARLYGEPEPLWGTGEDVAETACASAKAHAATRTAYSSEVAIVIRGGVPLAPFTTLELGGPARHFVDAADEATIVEALRWADARQLPVALLGGGSNVVVSDAGFDGLVVRIGTRGLRFALSGGEAEVTAAAGEPWDALVTESVGRGLGGLECLSGIPGLVGATPIQNVGAYGQEVAETIRAVRVLERGTWQTRQLSPEDCGFGYRDSNFKREPTRFVILAVTFGLRPGAAPVLRYRELAESLAGAGSSKAPPTLADARATVLALRAGKSMLASAGDPNRRSVGSFFTNPIVEAAEAEAAAARAGDGAGMPRWPTGDGRVKLSAGWLIERAGIAKGLRRGPVGVSSAHALALVHHGGGTTAALIALAREIREAVRMRFGVTLVPEPTFVGVTWNLSSG